MNNQSIKGLCPYEGSDNIKNKQAELNPSVLNNEKIKLKLIS